MKYNKLRQKILQLLAWFLAAVIATTGLVNFYPETTMAETPEICAQINNPLTAEEEEYAKLAWQYFVNNYQENTGFVNSANGYPSGTLWDMGNYLMALNAARWLNLIDQGDFDSRLNKFLQSLGKLQLFEDSLPNKVYQAATGALVDYGNNPTARGIGWSALDIGRILAAFHVIRSCHPQYNDWLTSIIGQWDIGRSLQNEQLFGATVLPNGETLLVQEGRLGYEEYAARGYELWGYQAPVALSFEPFQFVNIYDVPIPVDTRDFQTTNANNYVVSESYILDGIEFGFEGDIAEYAARVLEVQRRRYQETGQLTAVSEDNVNQPPYFLYNTVYANGKPWATITENNQDYPELKTISCKAAFGWRFLYPDNDYARNLYDAIKQRCVTPQGVIAGIYEANNQLNDILTGNTNGLVLEILYYKARGDRPLIGYESVTPSTGKPIGQDAALPILDEISPIPPVGKLEQSLCPLPQRPLTATEKKQTQAAWQYFETNFEPKTGLVNDRADVKGVTPWGIGNYLIALQIARNLDLIEADKFDLRVRQLLATLQKIPLFAGQLPHRSYHSQTLEPVDYGGNPSPTGTGWSSLDVARLMASLYHLKTCYPPFAEVVDQTLLQWNYAQLVKDQQLLSGEIKQDEHNRILTRIISEQRLGYEEYAARALQLWGFEVNKSSVGDSYQWQEIEGLKVPLYRQNQEQNPFLVTNPFLYYGLEFGFDPQMQKLIEPIFEVQQQRYQRTGILTAAATTVKNRSPYIIHSAIAGWGQNWPAKAPNQDSEQPRIVSTAVAAAFAVLFPNQEYSRQLWQATSELYDPQKGYYEGFTEENRKAEPSFSNATNTIILESIFYGLTNYQPLMRPDNNPNSPWWQANAQGQNLPEKHHQTANFLSSEGYWTSLKEQPNTTNGQISQSNADEPQKTPTTAPITPEQLFNNLTEADQQAAHIAWKYIENNYNNSTGLINAVQNYTWTTLWDQGSAILALHSGYQLGLINEQEFVTKIERLLTTLEKLPLSKTGLPNKAYSTNTAQMRSLNNENDPQGRAGWSVLDTARFLLSLHVLKTYYPQFGDRLDTIVNQWQLSQLTKDGWLQGGKINPNNQLITYQEGRLGYEQYAASSLKLWGIEAEKALFSPPVKTVTIEGVKLDTDQRNFANSNASNYLTNDPYLLWGLELGWPENIKPQVNNLLEVQKNRYNKTQILTAVNEDSLDRPPYFLYYNVYANGQTWPAIDINQKSYPHLRFLSSKAAFGLSSLFPQDEYTQKLRQQVQNLGDVNLGYFAGRYENKKLGINKVFNINTNAIILESLLYKARNNLPLTEK